MTLMRVAAHDGYVLTYDTDDAAEVHIGTPADVHEVGVTENGYPLRELGQAHLELRVDFKPDKRAEWISRADAALPDLRSSARFLTAALDAEDVPAELASRIYNRFFYGDPEGLAGKPRAVERDDGR